MEWVLGLQALTVVGLAVALYGLFRPRAHIPPVLPSGHPTQISIAP